MELNMKELEQVNGGDGVFDFFKRKLEEVIKELQKKPSPYIAGNHP